MLAKEITRAKSPEEIMTTGYDFYNKVIKYQSKDLLLNNAALISQLQKNTKILLDLDHSKDLKELFIILTVEEDFILRLKTYIQLLDTYISSQKVMDTNKLELLVNIVQNMLNLVKYLPDHHLKNNVFNTANKLEMLI